MHVAYLMVWNAVDVYQWWKLEEQNLVWIKLLIEYIPNSDSKTQWIFQNAKSTIPAPPPSLTVLESFAFI